MKSILIADDDNDILESLSTILRLQGFLVIPFKNGKRVVQLLQYFKPNLALIDIHLGEHDGRELCKEIKTIDEISHIPVILFSANHDHASNISAYPCSAFLEKPFDVEELTSVLNHHLNLPQLSEQ